MATKIIITGVGGFIGYHVASCLLQKGYTVIGVDNLNNYYDVKLKQDRLQQLKHVNFTFYKISLEDNETLVKYLKNDEFSGSVVIHLAAQAGVKYSLINPGAYVQSNLVGFANILELSRLISIKHLLYASSSSVYGANQKVPFYEKDQVNHPLTLYAATKRSNELMAHAYSINGLPTTGMRFFNVYGPWGRPDMALFLFTKAILERKPIYINNNGNMFRDFTYIEDVVESIVRLIDQVPIRKPIAGSLINPNQSYAPFQLFNIGNQKPINLMKFISLIEEKLGMKAIKRYLPNQETEVFQTFADVQELQDTIQFSPNTSIEKGIEKFLDWYFVYYQPSEHRMIQ
ncbi:NAD-dependent epimerase/dehydratase family protein [Shimazuella sp. AN120528]|uniref:NAD-dependent epimerase/dehydratase family protein n=1 Tax=Shimazuella soli TaxID=1892854 RepID=UPI001F0FFA1A|nr:NAD-dependent epimerase/dehydratase family protein [Shimazuella soli]MCH5586338.1 NAD-dependent epimerase/dehydratase family protein [Shimazuella soli]